MDNLISKGRYQNYAGVMIAIATAFLALILWFFVKQALVSEYIQLYPILIAVFFVVLYLVFLFKKLEDIFTIDVYDNYLLHITHAGRKKNIIHFSHITQYGEIRFRSRNYIYLFYSGKHLLYPQADISNDMELLHQLRAWSIKKEDDILERDMPEKPKSFQEVLFNIALILICCGLINKAYIQQPFYFKQGDLTPISGHLSRMPQIHTSKKNVTTVTFKLAQYPNLSFTIDDMGYKAMHTVGLHYVLYNTEARLWITNKDFHKYIIRDTSLNYVDKHFTFNKIPVYGVELNGTSLLTYQALNYAEKENHENARTYTWLIVLMLLVIVFRKRIIRMIKPQYH